MEFKESLLLLLVRDMKLLVEKCFGIKLFPINNLKPLDLRVSRFYQLLCHIYLIFLLNLLFAKIRKANSSVDSA